MTPLCQITRNGGCPSRTADQIWKSPTGCADRYSSNNCVLAFGGTAFIGVQRGHPLPPFPLPLPLSLEGFPKGRNRSFAPLCRFKGVRGEIEIPPRFSLGGWGDILFSKENIPLASPYRNGTVPPGTPVSLRQRFLLLTPNGNFPAGAEKFPYLLNLQFLRHIIQIDGQDLTDALFLHGDAVQHVGGLHGAPAVGDDNELRLIR